MTRIFCIIFVVVALLAAGGLTAQSIRLVRSDVDSSRSHFITATFRFGVDITLADAPGCTGAAFELRYTNATVVRFSGWSAGSFGSRGTLQVDQTDLTTGAGKISVGALLGDPAYSRGIDNPIIIHLDFVVTPDAIHNQTSVFTFVNAQGIINKDSGTIVQLTSNPRPFAIRSFITVWPGDADNNGLVDTRDYSQIGRFIGNNDSLTKFRGFQRQPSSTYWSPQTALAWDSAQATYADCDGSGDVTITDLLVVLVNFGKVISGAKSRNPLVVPYNSGNNSSVLADGVEKIPIVCTSDRDFLGAAGKVAWNMYNEYQDAEVIGIEAGELFCDNIMLYYNINDKEQYAEFAIGSLNHACQARKGGGVLAYLLIKPRRPGTFPLPMLQTSTGITVSGLFFPLQTVSDVQEETINSPDVSVYISNGKLYLNSQHSASVSITNILGEQVVNSDYSTSDGIDIQHLPVGVYFAVVNSARGVLAKKLIIAE